MACLGLALSACHHGPNHFYDEPTVIGGICVSGPESICNILTQEGGMNIEIRMLGSVGWDPATHEFEEFGAIMSGWGFCEPCGHDCTDCLCGIVSWHCNYDDSGFPICAKDFDIVSGKLTVLVQPTDDPGTTQGIDLLLEDVRAVSEDGETLEIARLRYTKPGVTGSTDCLP